MGDALGAFSRFHRSLRIMFEDSFPLKVVRIKKLDIDKPYVTREMKCLIKEKHRLERLVFRWPVTYKKKFNEIKNKLKKMNRKLKCTFYRNRVNTQDKKESWKVIGEILGRGGGRELPSYIIQNDEQLTDDINIANSFNSYFCSVGASLASKFVTDCSLDDLLRNIPTASSNFAFTPVSELELTNAISTMKDSSPGYDQVPLSIIRENFVILKPILMYLFNLSIRSGVFPSELKIARVAAAHKGGSPHDRGNYRPISILNSLSCLFEKIIYSKFRSFLSDNGILTDRQFGFREGRSTEAALHTVISSIYENLGRGNVGVGVFLDLSKAFDSLDRGILLKKLEAYGVRGRELSWFRSYLSNRYICTGWKCESSELGMVNYGVPQGSVLGPALFLLYVNDLERVCTHSSVLLFADDTSVFHMGKSLNNVVREINLDLGYVSSWLVNNRLTLNVVKTHYLLFRGARRSLVDCVPVKIGTSILNRQTTTKFLGINISENLKWNAHTDYVSAKISKFVPIFYKIRCCLDRKSLLSIYNALVYPNLNYCNSVWGVGPKSSLQQLWVIQKKLIRCISGAEYRAHSPPLFVDLKCLDVHDINVYFTCIYVFKSILNDFPVNSFTYYENVYNTRRAVGNYLNIPRVNLELCRNSVLYRGPLLYNALPDDIKTVNNVNSFKYNLKKYLLLRGVS